MTAGFFFSANCNPSHANAICTFLLWNVFLKDWAVKTILEYWYALYYIWICNRILINRIFFVEILICASNNVVFITLDLIKPHRFLKESSLLQIFFNNTRFPWIQFPFFIFVFTFFFIRFAFTVTLTLVKFSSLDVIQRYKLNLRLKSRCKS